MHKAIQYLLVFVAMGILISTTLAQDAFDKAVAQIKALETKLEENRKLVAQKTAKYRKNHKDNAPKDMFESDAMYEAQVAKLDVSVSNHRLELLKSHIEADQIELARLHREQIPSKYVAVTLGTYDANDEFFPITFETSAEKFTERLDIKPDDARILYENWDKVSKEGSLLVGPTPTYRRILAKVTLAYPDLWRKPVVWYFSDADTMVLIPTGDFEMGSNDSEAEGNEKPVHTVYLDAFYIDKYQVTVGQYKQFVQATGHPPPKWDWISIFSPTDQHPIVYVSWHDAMAYARWIGKRLPTEAEWEKAARGGLISAKYPWGNATPNGTQCNFADKNGILGDQNADDGYRYTAPVGSFPANGYDLHDMAGNVREWCLDEYQKDFYSSSLRRNPISGTGSITELINNFKNNKLTNDSRVLRGGSWVSSSERLRVACRYRYGWYIPIGFRCARSVTP